jgi:WD40 repeat protein
VRIAVPLITVLGALVVLVVAPSRSTVAAPAAAPGPHPADIHPPPLHSRDMMRRAGGVLWWIGTGCRLERVTMSTLVATGAEARECRAWPSPNGTVVLAQGRPVGRAPVVAVRGSSMQELHSTTVHGRVSRVTWSADSGFAAVCTSDRRHGTRLQLLSAPFRNGETVGYRCTTAFTPTGTTLTSDGHAIYENGNDLRLGKTLEIAAGRPRHGYTVTALTAAPSGLAVALAPVDPTDPNAQFAILVLNRETGSSSTFRTNLPSFDLAVAPDGSAFWYEQARGHDLLQSLQPGGVPAGAPPIAASYAWSPDGRYLAVALNDQVKVFDRRTGATGSIPAADPRSLTWTP